MSRAWKSWMELGAPHQIVEWLMDGVPLPISQATKQSSEMSLHLEELLAMGAYTMVTGATVTSPMFLLSKKDGTMRGIHDLRAVNRYLPKARFSLRGIRDSIRLIRECNWGATLDLKKGYYQVLMHPDARQYLGAEVGETIMVANVLPFGLSIAPHVFQTLTAFVGRLIRQLAGVQVVVYLDDFLLGAGTKQKLGQAIGIIMKLFKKLGMVVSPKCSLTPSQTLTFPGLEWERRRRRCTGRISRRY